jgi:hypothetical protein
MDCYSTVTDYSPFDLYSSSWLDWVFLLWDFWDSSTMQVVMPFLMACVRALTYRLSASR